MAHSVVCLSATDGASGEEIAPLVASRLGFRLIDEQIIARAAREAGVKPHVVAGVEQRKSLISRLLSEIPASGMTGASALMGETPVHDDAPTTKELRGLIRSAIEEIADHGEVVIIAHAASLALATHPDVLRVMVTASPETRAGRLAAARECEPKEAAKLIARGDANRADYVKRFYHAGEERPTDYDLLVNTDRMTTEQAADLIAHAAQA